MTCDLAYEGWVVGLYNVMAIDHKADCYSQQTPLFVTPSISILSPTDRRSSGCHPTGRGCA